MSRISAQEKRRRWERLQKTKISETIYKTNVFDGEGYEGVQSSDLYNQKGERK